MLVKEQWGVENVPIWLYLMLITRTQSKLLWSLWEPRLMKTRLMPMLVKKQWGVENVPIWHYLMLITRTQSKLLRSLCEPRLMKTRLKLKSILVSNANKHFKLILIDTWILVKILEPNCLPRLSNFKIENITVQLLFYFFIQFSAIEIRSVFSHAKLMMSWLTWLQKKSLLVSYSHFSTERTQYQGRSTMFSMCTCTSARKWRHKLCAVRMHNANVRNHHKWFLLKHSSSQEAALLLTSIKNHDLWVGPVRFQFWLAL